MRIGEFIKQRRTQLRLSQAALADLIGVSRTAVGQWEAGQTAPTRRHIPDVARALQIEHNALYPLLGPALEAVDTSTLAGTVPLMGWDEFVLGGSPVFDLPRISVGADLPTDAIALRVLDDSMAPEFSGGDLVVVSRSTAPIAGDAVIADVDGEGLLRSYHPRGTDKAGQIVFDLVINNPDYPTITCNSTNGYKVLGTVLAHWKTRKR